MKTTARELLHARAAKVTLAGQAKDKSPIWAGSELALGIFNLLRSAALLQKEIDDLNKPFAGMIEVPIGWKPRFALYEHHLES